jgi:hypothetical protein
MAEKKPARKGRQKSKSTTGKAADRFTDEERAATEEARIVALVKRAVS